MENYTPLMANGKQNGITLTNSGIPGNYVSYLDCHKISRSDCLNIGCYDPCIVTIYHTFVLGTAMGWIKDCLTLVKCGPVFVLPHHIRF